MIMIGAVAQSDWAFAEQAKGWPWESKPRQTQVVKTGSEGPTAKSSEIDVSVTGPRRWPE